MAAMLFDDGTAVARTLFVGVLAYAVLIVFLRVSGNRTLSKMNAFDFVVTVALGSTLATILLNQDVALAEGATALGLLVALQFVVTWLSTRTRWVRRLVTGEPSLLAFRGQLIGGALKRARVTEDEVRAAVRAQGLAQLGDVEAVVLETDGSFSVVRRPPRGGDAPESREEEDASSLRGVGRP